MYNSKIAEFEQQYNQSINHSSSSKLFQPPTKNTPTLSSPKAELWLGGTQSSSVEAELEDLVVIPVVVIQAGVFG